MKIFANRTGIGQGRCGGEWNDLRRVLGGLFLLSASVAGFATEGYLPRLGPAPLRFHSAAEITNRYSSPVSTVDEASPSPDSGASVPSPVDKGAAGVIPSNPIIPVDPPKQPELPGPETNRIETASSPGPAMLLGGPGGLVFGPQMLLHYFPVPAAPGDTTTDVLIPFNFVPPQPWVHPSSTAVLTNPPPENK